MRATCSFLSRFPGVYPVMWRDAGWLVFAIVSLLACDLPFAPRAVARRMFSRALRGTLGARIQHLWRG